MAKRVILLVMVLLMALLSAQAAFLPAYDALVDAYDAGQPVCAEISVSFDKLSAAGDGLTLLNEMLSPLAVSMYVRNDAQALKVSHADSELAAVSGALVERQMGEGALDALLSLYLNGMPAVYERLALSGEVVQGKRSTTIKNVGAATEQTVYTHQKEEAQALLEDVRALLSPYLDVLYAKMDNGAALQAYVENLVFEEALVVKHYTTDGQSVGLQITTRVSNAGEDRRKVTLYGGYAAGTGAYLSVKCPATRGNNNLDVQLSLAFKEAKKQNTLTGSLKVTRRLGDEKYSLDHALSLKNVFSDAGDTVSGKVTLKKTEAGQTTTLTLTPNLTALADVITGTVTVAAVENKIALYTAQAGVTVRAVSPEEFPTPTGADGQAQLTSFSRELLTALGNYVAAMPQEQRLMAYHLLRSDAWMNGETAPPLLVDAAWLNEHNQWAVMEGE